LLKVKKSLENVDLSCSNYIDILQKSKKGDFVYLDPPYHKENKTSFTKYQKGDFDEKEQKELDKIIQLIQYYIHPDYKSPAAGLESSTFRSVSRGLLTYPALMQVELVGVSGNLKTVFKSGKYLMVNQFAVDYTPQGMVLNKGGTASVIRCSLNTTESEIHTRADYRYGEFGALGDESNTLSDILTDVLDGAADIENIIQGETDSQLSGAVNDLADKYNVTA